MLIGFITDVNSTLTRELKQLNLKENPEILEQWTEDNDTTQSVYEPDTLQLAAVWAGPDVEESGTVWCHYQSRSHHSQGTHMFPVCEGQH